MMVYHISRFCLVLMCMQHNHMVNGKLHIHHYLVLDQNANDNSFSTPLRHEVWNVDHKMVIMGIDLCYKIISHIGVQHQHYPEHDTACLSIFFPWNSPPPWSNTPFLRCLFFRWCWNSLTKLISYFWLPVWICIQESNLFDPGSWTVDINWYI